ncbi:unnamed protein product, partial [Mesorhabditis spiculigera]
MPKFHVLLVPWLLASRFSLLAAEAKNGSNANLLPTLDNNNEADLRRPVRIVRKQPVNAPPEIVEASGEEPVVAALALALNRSEKAAPQADDELLTGELKNASLNAGFDISPNSTNITLLANNSDTILDALVGTVGIVLHDCRTDVECALRGSTHCNFHYWGFTSSCSKE